MNEESATPAQEHARRELRLIASEGGTPLQRTWDRGVDEGALTMRLRLDTTAIKVEAGGLPLVKPFEEVLVIFPAVYPWVPPQVRVDHDRFTGSAHVLQGTDLCLYLDGAQEWHPQLGVAGFLNRLWAWLNEAAAASFDPRKALFHPVGGVLHQSPGTPTLVVRQPLVLSRPGLATMAIHQRASRRVDLLAAQHSQPEADRCLVIATSGTLPYGAGSTFGQLLAVLAHESTFDVSALTQALAATAARNSEGRPLYVVLAVPGGFAQQDPRHLICARLPASATTAVRRSVRQRGGFDAVLADGALLDTALEWCRVSEERTSVSTRRDSGRPVAHLLGKRVVLWGCGGLGSWVGEFVTRAGAAQLTLADPGIVSGGLLVRQNYVENDVGLDKATALAARLSAVRDDLLMSVTETFGCLRQGSLPDCDVLIDCTVSNSVAAACAAVWPTTTTTPLVARIATDRASSSLGLLTLTRPGPGQLDPEEADRATGLAIGSDAALEPFRCFWDEPLQGDELIPEPGCSVPTFHGAATDLAAIAAMLVNLLSFHLDPAAPLGSHVVALPTNGVLPGHRWMPQAVASPDV